MSLGLTLRNPANPREWLWVDTSPKAFAEWLGKDRASDSAWLRSEKARLRGRMKGTPKPPSPPAPAPASGRTTWKSLPPAPTRLDPRGFNLEMARTEAETIGTWLHNARAAPGLFSPEQIEQHEKAEAYLADVFRYWGTQI